MTDTVALAIITSVTSLFTLTMQGIFHARMSGMADRQETMKGQIKDVAKSVDGMVTARVDAATAVGNLEGRSQQTEERIAAKGEPDIK